MTNGGKTTLSNRLAAVHPGSKVINQDIYFRNPQDANHIWVELPQGGRHQNWEHLNSVDWDKLVAALENELATPPDRTSARPLILIEGHLVLSCP